jgi:D-alanyl-lipoteichoic acid acyltransferase DltB (MBOAT superfamily)
MCWKPDYIIILAAATLIDYFIARFMARTKPGKKRKLYLLFSLFVSVGTLFLFKYFNFFNDSLRALLSQFNIMYNIPAFKLLLPVGLSYYTFKKISYIVDVYRENREPETHLGKFALYVSFFPEISAGPIDRSGDLLPQFDTHHHLEYDRVMNGLKLFAWGLFKKIVIADRLSLVVNRVYDHPAEYQGISLAVATLYFSFQIFADFSGYTDMAIGIGQVLGFRLAENFDRPYFSKSISEFWRRWHMSFTGWLRDYLFLPIAYAVSRKIKSPFLGYIKAETWAYVSGTLITMLLCGLWHGAGWTFVLWGGLHGIYLVLSFATRKARKKWRKKNIGPRLKPVYKVARILMTFLAVSFLWIFFRANSISDAFYFVSHIFNPADWAIQPDTIWLKESIFLGQSKVDVIITLLAIGCMMMVHGFQSRDRIRRMFTEKPMLLRWLLYILLVLAVLNLGVVKEVPFIYAEF